MLLNKITLLALGACVNVSGDYLNEKRLKNTGSEHSAIASIMLKENGSNLGVI